MWDEIRLIGTTDGSGDATIIATRPTLGKLYAVEMVDGDLADGVDATLSAIRTGSGVNQTLLTMTNFNTDQWVYPRAGVHDLTGTALTYDSTQAVSEPPIINGVLQLVLAQGGDTKTGGCIVYVEK